MFRFIFISLLTLLCGATSWGQKLNLATCIKSTLEKHPLVKEYQKVLKQHDYKIKQIVAQYFPSLKLTGSYSKSSQELETGDKKVSDQYSLSLSASHLLFSKLERFYNYRMAKLAKEVARQGYYSQLRDLVYDVKETYSRFIYAKKQVKVLKKMIERKQEDYAIIQLKYQSGQESNSSVLEMKTDVTNTEFQLTEANEELALATKQLLLLMGNNESQNLSLQNTYPVFPDFHFGELYQKAENLSIDLETLRLSLKSAKYEVSSNQGSSYLPEISLSGGMGVSDEKFVPNRKNWSVGVAFSFNIFNGGSDSFKIGEAKQKTAVLRNKLLKTKKNLKINLLNLYKKYILLKKKQEVSDLKYENALKIYQLARLEYQQGRNTFMWFRQKETELSQLELAKEANRYNTALALFVLEKYTRRLPIEK